jgi:hypothetical protein
MSTGVCLLTLLLRRPLVCKHVRVQALAFSHDEKNSAQLGNRENDALVRRSQHVQDMSPARKQCMYFCRCYCQGWLNNLWRDSEVWHQDFKS